MGLGLSICYRIMQQHGGSIEVQSEPGVYSEFTLRFPRAARRHGGCLRRVYGIGLRLSEVYVLYVDDEEMALKYFTRAFENTFPILTALNATDGYRLLEQNRERIGLVITDQRMPGEKGVQFLERARQLHPRAIRILTTAYSDLNVAIEAVNSGAIYKYVTKPWDIPQLR